MKIQKLFALVILTSVASTAWATGCGGGGGYNPPNCVVTWDFTDPNSVANGDPLTYVGTSNQGGTFNLAIRGFTIGSSMNGTTWDGKISDGQAIISVDGSNGRGLGVTAAGEGSHWGGKIDNFKSNDSENNELKYFRDAILLDFDNCVVSLDQIRLESIYDTDFQLWSIGGGEAAALALAIANDPDGDPDLSLVLDDYNDWGTIVSPDYTFVTTSLGGNSHRTATITDTGVSRFFVLIAGDDHSSYNDDAFRIKKLSANCVNANCDNGGGNPGGGVPVPGTLALLGLGALLGRKRFLKLA